MKTKYAFIHFVPAEVVDGHPSWKCHNTKHGDIIGFVRWYKGWKCYVFEAGEAIFSSKCLDDISNFLTQIVAVPCDVCGQIDQGQTGEYPCPQCGLPRLWDKEV